MSKGNDKKKSRWLLGAQGMGRDSSTFSTDQRQRLQSYGVVTEHDASEATLYNTGFVLGITHVPTNRHIEFSAFITDHSDAFTSNWVEETVFGRMDPIATFESTKRVASLGFSVPAYSRQQAVENMARINTLLSFLYPTYTDKGGPTGRGVSTINMGPLVRVKFANLITNTDAPSKGLLGYITTGITVTPNMEAGVFMDGTSGEKTSGIQGPEILYKAYDLNFELSVLHEHSLGFTKGIVHGQSHYVFRNQNGAFPYHHKKHLPYTIHGLKGSQPTPAKSTNLIGDPNSEQRKAFVRGLKTNEAARQQVLRILSASGVPSTRNMLQTVSTKELSAATRGLDIVSE
jgi:hypothetical protein